MALALNRVRGLVPNIELPAIERSLGFATLAVSVALAVRCFFDAPQKPPVVSSTENRVVCQNEYDRTLEAWFEICTRYFTTCVNSVCREMVTEEGRQAKTMYAVQPAKVTQIADR